MAETPNLLTLTPGTLQQSTFTKCGDGCKYDGVELTTTENKTAYTARLPITLNPGTTISGDGKATVELVTSADPTVWKPLIPVFAFSGEKYLFENFIFDGMSSKQSVPWGKGYHNLFGGSKASKVTIQGMNIHNSMGDGARIIDSKDINFVKNKVYGIGHDGFYVERCTGVEAAENIIYTRIDAALRCRGSSDVTFRNNWIYSTSKYTPRTGPGIIAQIDETAGSTSKNVKIFENWIEGCEGPGMWIVTHTYDYTKASSIEIYRNVIKACGQMQAVNKLPGVAGICLDGWNAEVYDNTIDQCSGAAFRVGNYITTSKGDGYKVNIEGNILTGTKKASYPDKYSGIGLVNIRDNHEITVDENCFYGNTAGDYYGVKPTGSILKNPVYSDAQYHLSTSSPCMFADKQLGRYNNSSPVSPDEPDTPDEPDEPTEDTPAEVFVTCDQGDAENIIKNLSEKYTIYR